MSPSQTTPPTAERNRISIDVSPAVMSLLDNISEVTGVPKSQVVYGALLDHLAELVQRSVAIKMRQAELLKARK